MKKVLTLAFIALFISANAQVALEHSFNVYNLETVNFSNANVGEKYFSNTEQVSFYNHPDTLTIYNSDYSIYKVIPIPVNYIYSDLYTINGSGVPSISDELFNTDSLFEYVAAKALTSGNNSYSVFSESGQILFTFPDTNSSGIGIMKMGADFKLLSHNYCNSTNCITAVNVFSVPGSLPCSQCSSFTSGIEGPSGTGVKMGFDAHPNPFNNMLNINYTLPYQQDAKIVLTDILGQELMNIKVSRQSDNLSINTSGIAKGVVIITLYGSKGDPISKKLIKIE
jgi:hypothetical protein